MSKIKNFYHDEITNGQNQDDHIDEELRMKEAEEDVILEAQAEEANFFRIFQLTSTYPM